MVKKSNKKSILMWVIGGALVLYTAILVVLFIWALFASVKAPNGLENLFRGNELGFPKGWPWEWTWSNYKVVLDNIYVDIIIGNVKYRLKFLSMIINTIIYALGGAFVATMTPCLVAYAAAKTDFKFNKVLDFIVLVTMMIPVVGAYPSEIQILKTLNLYDTWLGAFIQKFNFLGTYYLILRATFEGISNTYAESAYIEGAGEYRVLFSIMLPLAKNVILIIMLMQLIGFWNDYQYPLLYLYSKPTLAYGVFYLVFLNAENFLLNIPMKMAGSIMLFMPILIVFIIFKDSLMTNLSMGGLKE